MHQDPFGCLRTIPTETGEKQFFHLPTFARKTGVDLMRLPRSLRILVESLLRHIDGFQVSAEDVLRLARREGTGTQEIPFHPGRVVLQDFTGVPAIVDLAALRSAMERM